MCSKKKGFRSDVWTLHLGTAPWCFTCVSLQRSVRLHQCFSFISRLRRAAFLENHSCEIAIAVCDVNLLRDIRLLKRISRPQPLQAQVSSLNAERSSGESVQQRGRESHLSEPCRDQFVPCRVGAVQVRNRVRSIRWFGTLLQDTAKKRTKEGKEEGKHAHIIRVATQGARELKRTAEEGTASITETTS